MAKAADRRCPPSLVCLVEAEVIYVARLASTVLPRQAEVRTLSHGAGSDKGGRMTQAPEYMRQAQERTLGHSPGLVLAEAGEQVLLLSCIQTA